MCLDLPRVVDVAISFSGLGHGFLLVFSEEYEDVACSLCKFGWFMDASTGLCTECGEAQKIGMLLGSMKVSDNSCCPLAQECVDSMSSTPSGCCVAHHVLCQRVSFEDRHGDCQCDWIFWMFSNLEVRWVEQTFCLGFQTWKLIRGTVSSTLTIQVACLPQNHQVFVLLSPRYSNWWVQMICRPMNLLKHIPLQTCTVCVDDSRSFSHSSCASTQTLSSSGISLLLFRGAHFVTWKIDTWTM